MRSRTDNAERSHRGDRPLAEGTLPVRPVAAVEALLLHHAARFPGRLALEGDDEKLTYGELRSRVANLAAGLTSSGVRRGDRVALHLPNSAGFAQAALACLWVGAAFVPLSPDEAAARLEQIVQDCAPSLIIKPEVGQEPVGRGIPGFTVSELLATPGSTPPPAADRRRDAYLIYTSGTAGRPKGVRIPVEAFLHSIGTTASGVGLGPTTRSMSVSPFHFDGSYATLFATLLAGGTVVIPNRKELLFLRRFFRCVREDAITHCSFSPSYLRLLLSSPKFSSLGGTKLRTLGLGGEQLVARDLLRLWEVLPEVAVYNYYGPTETTIEVTSYRVDPADVAVGVVPLGHPHAGVTFHLIGEDGNLIERADEVGELFIGGSQLMAGYWGDELLTSQVLRTDVVPGLLAYKTGDLARRDGKGRYHYAGRKDDVLKRRGVRISLTEVGRVLLSIPGVTGAICLPVDRDGELAIVGFVESAEGRVQTDVRSELRSRLPENMLPDEVVILDALPTTNRDKVDRVALLRSSGFAPWNSQVAFEQSIRVS